MRYTLIFLWILLITSCSSASKDTQQTVNDNKRHIDGVVPDKRENKKRDSLYVVARVDKRSQRVFVVVAPTTAIDIKKVRFIVGQVKKAYKFTGSLSITFVSDSKYAGYKDELEMNYGIPYMEFYSNYLGEYDQLTKEYWTFPALPDKKIKYQVD